MQRLFASLMLALVAIVAVFAIAHRGPWMAPFAIGIGVWVMAGAVQDLITRSRFGDLKIGVAMARLRGLPRGAYGMACAHFGVGLMVVGIAATSAYRLEQNIVMKPDQTVDFADYQLTFKGVAPARGPNYVEQQGVFAVGLDGQPLTTLRPAKRVYQASRQNTTEAGIRASFVGDLYVILGDEKDAGAYSIKLYFNPLVRFIWIGAVIMFIGGFLSLSDRKLRVGAPRRAARQEASDAPAV